MGKNVYFEQKIYKKRKQVEIFFIFLSLSFGNSVQFRAIFMYINFAFHQREKGIYVSAQGTVI
jgi:hypothetical protein